MDERLSINLTLHGLIGKKIYEYIRNIKAEVLNENKQTNFHAHDLVSER